MNTPTTVLALNTLSHGYPALLAEAWYQAKWMPKFAAAFVPAFLSTGLLFGMAYVLVMRAMKANRRNVEAWLEQQRVRLQVGPIPIIEKAQPVMLAALYAIYGRKTPERFRASLLIGLIFTGIIFSVVYTEYRSFPAILHERMTQLEQDADPKLFSYITDASLNPEYKKAFEYRQLGHYIEYTHTEPLYVELRNRQDNYLANFLTRLSADPDRVQLTLIYLMEGSPVERGFQLGNSALLFLFNVLTDFISASIVIVCVGRLGKKFSMAYATVMFLFAASGTLLCSLAAFLSYHGFFCGQTTLFMKLLLQLPATLITTIIGVWFIWEMIVSLSRKSDDGDRPDLISFLVSLVVLAGISFTGFNYLWIYWGTVSFRFNNWREMFAFPYILAATTFVPAALTIVAFGLMLAAKLVAEPARVLPESYMTFIKEEVGGSQVAGLTLIIGTIAGVVAGLIYT